MGLTGYYKGSYNNDLIYTIRFRNGAMTHKEDADSDTPSKPARFIPVFLNRCIGQRHCPAGFGNWQGRVFIF